MKINVSKVDRSDMIDLLPKMGSLSDVVKYDSWIDQLRYSKDELKELNKINEIKDHNEHDAAFNDWNNTKSEIEISEDLYSFLVTEIKTRDLSKAISVTDNYKLYQYLLSLSNE